MTPYICEKFDLRIRRKVFTGPEILKTLGHFLSVVYATGCSESTCPTYWL